jgi:hypothetical protein
MPSHDVPESDWKVLRELQRQALERFCKRAVDEVLTILRDVHAVTTGSSRPTSSSVSRSALAPYGHLPLQELFGEMGVRDHLEPTKVRQRRFDHRPAARLVSGIRGVSERPAVPVQHRRLQDAVR